MFGVAHFADSRCCSRLRVVQLRLARALSTCSCLALPVGPLVFAMPITTRRTGTSPGGTRSVSARVNSLLLDSNGTQQQLQQAIRARSVTFDRQLQLPSARPRARRNRGPCSRCALVLTSPAGKLLEK